MSKWPEHLLLNLYASIRSILLLQLDIQPKSSTKATYMHSLSILHSLWLTYISLSSLLLMWWIHSSGSGNNISPLIPSVHKFVEWPRHLLNLASPGAVPYIDLYRTFCASKNTLLWLTLGMSCWRVHMLKANSWKCRQQTADVDIAETKSKFVVVIKPDKHVSLFVFPLHCSSCSFLPRALMRDMRSSFAPFITSLIFLSFWVLFNEMLSYISAKLDNAHSQWNVKIYIPGIVWTPFDWRWHKLWNTQITWKKT